MIGALNAVLGGAELAPARHEFSQAEDLKKQELHCVLSQKIFNRETSIIYYRQNQSDSLKNTDKNTKIGWNWRLTTFHDRSKTIKKGFHRSQHLHRNKPFQHFQMHTQKTCTVYCSETHLIWSSTSSVQSAKITLFLCSKHANWPVVLRGSVESTWPLQLVHTFAGSAPVPKPSGFGHGRIHGICKWSGRQVFELFAFHHNCVTTHQYN